MTLVPLQVVVKPTGPTGFGVNVKIRLLRGIVVVVGVVVVVDVDMVVVELDEPTDVVVELDEPADVVVELDEPTDVVVELDDSLVVVVELDEPVDVLVVEAPTDVVVLVLVPVDVEVVDSADVVGGDETDVRTIGNVSGLAPLHASMCAPGVQLTLPVESGPA